MKTKDMLLALCMVVLGIAIGFSFARKVWPPTKVIVMRFNPVGEMSVAAKAGDHLEWFNGGVHTGVTFKYGLSACTNVGDAAKGTCTMKDSLFYKFDCLASGCQDPGVGGGDDTLQGTQFVTGGGHLPPPYADPATVTVYCDPATSKATADPPAVQGKLGTAFTIQVAGATDFTATFPAGTCDPGDTLNDGSPSCRIKPAVTVDTPYTYGITVQGCTNPGTATLKELKP